MEQETELSSLTYAERKKKISRDKRYACYEAVQALHREGLGHRVIAREMHMSRRTVHRYLSAKAFPERAPGSGMRPRDKSKLDPHLAYLRERWNAGEHTGSHLLREIKGTWLHQLSILDCGMCLVNGEQNCHQSPDQVPHASSVSLPSPGNVGYPRAA